MNHPGRRSRRIGDKNHGPAVGAVSHERVAGLHMSRDPIMNHAPDIAQDNVIARRNGGEAIEKMKGHCCQASDVRYQVSSIRCQVSYVRMSTVHRSLVVDGYFLKAESDF